MADTFIPIAIEGVEKAKERPSLTYKLDLERGRILGRVDGLAAVEQAIRKALITPRFRCLIYDGQYGSEIKNAIIAADATAEYAEATIPGFVRDALAPDTRILEVLNFTFEQQDERAHITCRVNTIFGETTLEEAI